MKGTFKPRNPSKYKGNAKNIIYRSSYEFKFFRYLDDSPKIEWWASEELAIPYFSPIDNKMHRYYPDVILKKKNGNVVMVEIKPGKQTKPPVPKMTKKGTPRKSYLNEMIEWNRNKAKWEAASTFCDKRGWEWAIFTEKELGIPIRGN